MKRLLEFLSLTSSGMPKKKVRFSAATNLEKDLTLKKLQFINWTQEVVNRLRNINSTPHSSTKYYTPAFLNETKNGNIIDKVAARMKSHAKQFRDMRAGQVSKIKQLFYPGSKVRISKKALKAAGVENDKTGNEYG